MSADFSIIKSPLADLPTVDANYLIGVLSRIFHILSAIILGGGLFYMRTMLAPSGPDACFLNRRAVWARWTAIICGLSLASGLYNFIMISRASRLPGAHELPMAYHVLFGLKFLLSLFVMFVASILPGKTELANKFRANLAKWLNRSWSAVVAIIVIAAIMRTLH